VRSPDEPKLSIQSYTNRFSLLRHLNPPPAGARGELQMAEPILNFLPIEDELVDPGE
jgi:hypothetical protein